LRDLVDALYEILARIDDGVGAAMGLGELRFLIAADSADDGWRLDASPIARG
jgi:hypothetical protein